MAKFVKGQSGNPAGRSKVAQEFKARASQAVDDHVIAAWINEVVTRGEHWVRCSELLANYGKGRPAQSVTHSGSLNVTNDYDKLSTREMMERAREMGLLPEGGH